MYLCSDIMSQSPNPLLDAVTQAVHLSSNKVQPVPLLLTLFQEADPVRVRGQGVRAAQIRPDTVN